MEHEGSDNAFGKKTREDGTILTPEIEEIDKQISMLTKEKDKSDELCKKVNLVFD